MFKKLLTVSLLALILGVNLAKPSFASAQQWWRPTIDEFSAKVDNTSIPANEIFGERYTFAQVHWIVYSLVLMFIDSELTDCSSKGSPDAIRSCLETIVANNQNGPAKYATGGILTLASLSDFMVNNKPASGITYISSVFDNMGIQTANAQQAGFGFGTLSPIQPIWAASRNAAYSLMALAVVALSFMVMFRTRISPQMSVSVMSAIPRVVIGFILITFSYAIAGFVIDLAYVVMGIIGAIFSTSGLMGSNPIDLFNRLNDMGGGMVSLVASEIVLIFGAGIIYGVGGGLGGAVLGALGGAAVGGAAVVGGPVVIAGLVMIVLMVIILIVAVFRIFWIFLRTYVMVLIIIIALPFGALGYVVSPSGNMFAQMLRSLISNIAVFVVVGLIIMFSHLIFWGFGALEIVRTLSFFNPYQVVPFYGSGAANLGLPGFTGADPIYLGAILGLVILLMAPGIASNVREWIATGRASGRMGELLGVGAASGIGGAAGIYAGQRFVNQMDAAALKGGISPSRKAMYQWLGTLTRVAGRGKVK